MKVDISRNPKIRERIIIHAHDCWSCDYTLAKIIAPMLKRLKKVTHGYPSNLSEKEWDEILGKIIWSMEEISSNNKNEPSPPIASEEKNLSRNERSKHFWRRTGIAGKRETTEAPPIDPREKSAYLERYEAYHQRLQDGCQLLGKWFTHLWD